jgi:hypothetical protein
MNGIENKSLLVASIDFSRFANRVDSLDAFRAQIQNNPHVIVEKVPNLLKIATYGVRDYSEDDNENRINDSYGNIIVGVVDFADAPGKPKAELTCLVEDLMAEILAPVKLEGEDLFYMWVLVPLLDLTDLDKAGLTMQGASGGTGGRTSGFSFVR